MTGCTAGVILCRFIWAFVFVFFVISFVFIHCLFMFYCDRDFPEETMKLKFKDEA